MTKFNIGKFYYAKVCDSLVLAARTECGWQDIYSKADGLSTTMVAEGELIMIVDIEGVV